MIRRILSDSQIIEIKEKYRTGVYTELQLSKEYRCSIMTISLWLKDDPYSVIKKKTRVRQSDFKGRKRCSICSRIIGDIQGNVTPCDCQKPKTYYSEKNMGNTSLEEVLDNERKSFYI